MQILKNHSSGQLQLGFRGAFTFSDNQQFRLLLREIQDDLPKEIRIDFSQLSQIDSAALGMLLLLRDTTEAEGCRLEFCQPQGQVKKMFDLSHFSELFTIRP